MRAVRRDIRKIVPSRGDKGGALIDKLDGDYARSGVA
jgi:hypothetical protein